MGFYSEEEPESAAVRTVEAFQDHSSDAEGKGNACVRKYKPETRTVHFHCLSMH